MKTQNNTRFYFKVEESEKLDSVNLSMGSIDTDTIIGRLYTSFQFTPEEFKEFREMIRDFYTKKEQEEHFAMMSQREPEAV
jgi:hypothetical protein